MSKKRRTTRSSEWNLSRLAMVAAGLAVVLAGFYLLASQEIPEVPDVDRSVLEPQVAEKIQNHREAVLKEPDRHDVWGQLGMVLHAHGLEAEASECYLKAVELEPDEFRWQYLLVHALRSLDNERALAQAKRALAADSSYSPAYVLRGELLEEVNEVDAALEHYEKAFALDSKSAMAAFGAGRLYLTKGELERALALLKRAAELDDAAGAIHASLAQVYRRMGEREKAVYEARLALERKSSIGIGDPIHFQMRRESVSSIAQLDGAQQATESGDYVLAETIYRGLVKLRPGDADMHARLGDTLALQDQREEAKSSYLSALAVNPEQPQALYGLGNLLSFEKKYDEAEERYRAALASRPDHVPTRLNLGRSLVFQGEIEKAMAQFREALALDPESFEAHLELATHLLRAREVDAGIEHLDAALALNADAGRAHFLLAMALAQKGSFGKAWKHAQDAERLGETLAPDVRRRLKQEAERGGR